MHWPTYHAFHTEDNTMMIKEDPYKRGQSNDHKSSSSYCEDLIWDILDFFDIMFDVDEADPEPKRLSKAK